MARNILVTGSASGIGQATAARLREAGNTVIGVDLHHAEIAADLGTQAGRAHMIAEAERLSNGRLDGVLAGAGIANYALPREILAINYFGAIATLEGLRPLLARSDRPRAVAICSTALMLPADETVIASCLAGDETAAREQILANPGAAYSSSKRALALWVRRAAARPEWGGEGLLLNGVGPGVIATPMTNPLFDQPEMVELMRRSNPMAVKEYAVADEVAELLTFLLGFENHYLTGQIIFIDGGTDIILRPELV